MGLRHNEVGDDPTLFVQRLRLLSLQVWFAVSLVVATNLSIALCAKIPNISGCLLVLGQWTASSLYLCSKLTFREGKVIPSQFFPIVMRFFFEKSQRITLKKDNLSEKLWNMEPWRNIPYGVVC